MHRHIWSFWAASPYAMEGGSEGYDDRGQVCQGDGCPVDGRHTECRDDDVGEQNSRGFAGLPPPKENFMKQQSKLPGTWKSKTRKRLRAVRDVTSLGKRPRFDQNTYYIPEVGRLLPRTATNSHCGRLREAIVACVFSNPGVTENQLLDRFWGHPACEVQGVLYAMLAGGELSCCISRQYSCGLFPGSDLPATVCRCFFIGSLSVCT